MSHEDLGNVRIYLTQASFLTILADKIKIKRKLRGAYFFNHLNQAARRIASVVFRFPFLFERKKTSRFYIPLLPEA